jgi:hypothetical protein
LSKQKLKDGQKYFLFTIVEFLPIRYFEKIKIPDGTYTKNCIWLQGLDSKLTAPKFLFGIRSVIILLPQAIVGRGEVPLGVFLTSTRGSHNSLTSVKMSGLHYHHYSAGI